MWILYVIIFPIFSQVSVRHDKLVSWIQDDMAGMTRFDGIIDYCQTCDSSCEDWRLL